MTDKKTRTQGRRLTLLLEDVGLFVILVATVLAAGEELWKMASVRSVALTDLLLLFIYMEIVTMVRSYWEHGRLPVRMPIYIAMIALARHLILTSDAARPQDTLATAGGVLILAISVLVVRFGHIRFPYGSPPEDE